MKSFAFFAICLFCGFADAQVQLTRSETLLLCKSDLFSVKVIISSLSTPQYELAGAYLKRAADCDANGEVEFYSAVLGLKDGRFKLDTPDFQSLMVAAADLKQPFALAWISDFHASQGRADMARKYRKDFDLEQQRMPRDYPDFSMALKIAKKFID